MVLTGDWFTIVVVPIFTVRVEWQRCYSIFLREDTFLVSYFAAGGAHEEGTVPGAIWQEETTLNCSSLYCRKQALEVIMTNKDAVPGAIWQEETLNWSFLFCRK